MLSLEGIGVRGHCDLVSREKLGPLFGQTVKLPWHLAVVWICFHRGDDGGLLGLHVAKLGIDGLGLLMGCSGGGIWHSNDSGLGQRLAACVNLAFYVPDADPGREAGG